jgi:hypothetical protein
MYDPGGQKLTATSTRDIGLYSTNLGMDLIMEEYWKLQENGFVMRDVIVDGVLLDNVLVVPYLGRFVADLVEMWDCLSISHYSHPFLHSKSRQDLADPKVRLYTV